MNRNEGAWMYDFLSPKLDDDIICMPFKDKYIVYSPSNNKISVLGDYSYRVLKMCNGSNTVSHIAQQIHYREDEIQEILKKNEIYFDSNRKVQQKEDIKKQKYLDCWFSITNDCNFCCPYCYIDKDSNDFTLEKAISVIDKLLRACEKRNINELHIRFAGGEPLLCFCNIEECVRYTEKVKGKIAVRYSIITNGSLITENICKWILENNIYINVSLDGLNEYHDKTRKYRNGKDSFKDVYKSICLLSKHGIHITVLTTVTMDNLDHLVELSRELVQFRNINIRYSFEKSVINHKPALVSEQEKLIRILNECLDLFEDEIQNGNLFFDFSLSNLHFSHKRYRSCGAGVKSIAVNCDEIVATCGMGLRRGYSDSKEEDYYTIVQDNDHLYNITTLEREKCKECIWKSACGGGCAIDNMYYWGVKDSYSPYCETIKAMILRLVRLHGVKMYYLTKQRSKENDY